MNGTAAKLVLLGSLYLAQGLPHGFFATAMPALLRKQGVSLTEIGLSMVVMLSWGLKFLWAPVVDRFGSARFGRRRSWIVPLQLGAIVGFVALAHVDVLRGLPVLMLGMAAVILLLATQDIAVDGLAVALLRPEERGLGNGVQVAAYRLGMIVSGGVLMIYSAELGWSGVFYAMAGMVALATLPILFIREPDAPRPERVVWGAFREFVRLPAMGTWFLVLVVFKFGESFAVSMLRPHLTDLGVTLQQLGWINGTVGALAGLVGALIGGWLVGRFGRWRMLLGFAGVQALAVASYALLPMPGEALDMRLVYGLCVTEYLSSGMASVALFTLMMDSARPHVAGSDYTIQASTVVLASGLAGGLSGVSADAFGFTVHYLIAAGLAALAIPAILLHRMRVGGAPSTVIAGG